MRFLSAQTISLLGSSIVQYGIIWYITLTTASGVMLTLSTICGFAPQIVMALFAGHFIEKYNAKRMIMIADSSIALATLSLAMVFLAGYKNYVLIYIVLAIRSAGTGIQTPCVNTLIPQLTKKEELMRFNGINSMLGSIIMVLSPAISGMILSIASLEALLFIDVVTAMIGVGLTATIKVHKKVKENHIAESDDMSISGLTYCKRHKKVKYLFFYQLMLLFFITPSAFLIPLLITRTFGQEVWRLTIGEMTYSIGTILGGILISVWGGYRNRIKTTILAGTLYGLLMIGLGISPFFIMFLSFNTIIGICAPCFNTSITVYLQENVVAEMHGRVFSIMQIATACAFPIGMCLFGPLADYVAIPYILMCCGLIVVFISFYFKYLLKQT